MAKKPKFEEAPDVAELLPEMIDKTAEEADNLPAGEVPKIKCLYGLGENLSYWGKICLTSGPWRYLNDYDYVLIVNKSVWEGFEDDVSKEALIFHELLHVGYRENAKGEITWGLRRHSIETFPEEVKVFGAWRPGLQALQEACMTHSLANSEH